MKAHFVRLPFSCTAGGLLADPRSRSTAPPPPRDSPPRDWPGLEGRATSLTGVLGESYVGLGTGHALQEHITRQPARLGGHLHFRIRVPGLDNVCRLVAQGAGIAIVPESAARRSARTLRRLRLTDDWATRQLNLCARRFDDLTPQAKLLAAALV